MNLGYKDTKRRVTNAQEHSVIGMLCWEKGKIPRGLEQLAELPGNATNPETFDFPIRYERIQGANFETIIERPNMEVLNLMIEVAQRMEQDGIRAITTSCGFNAILQRRLADAVDIPVLASSLMQIPLVYAMLKADRKIGVVTADKRFLTREHLREVGVGQSIPVSITGLEETEEFSKVHADPDIPLDLEKFKKELLATVEILVEQDPNIGAIVLECTDLPPFAADIRQAVNLPVFDIVTLINLVYNSLV